MSRKWIVAVKQNARSKRAALFAFSRKADAVAFQGDMDRLGMVSAITTGRASLPAIPVDHVEEV